MCASVEFLPLKRGGGSWVVFGFMVGVDLGNGEAMTNVYRMDEIFRNVADFCLVSEGLVVIVDARRVFDSLAIMRVANERG